MTGVILRISAKRTKLLSFVIFLFLLLNLYVSFLYESGELDKGVEDGPPHSLLRNVAVVGKEEDTLKELAYSLGQQNPSPPNLEIHVIGCSRPLSLTTLLSQITTANYDGRLATIDLYLHVDNCPGEDYKEIINSIVTPKSIRWRYGDVIYDVKDRQNGLRKMWLDIFNASRPKKDTLMLILEDDMRVSPYYYQWLIAVSSNIDLFDPQLVGISLSPIKVEELRKPFSRFHAYKHLKQTDSVYQTPVPSSWGGCYNSNYAGEFYDFAVERLKFYDESEDSRKDSVKNYGDLKFFPDSLLYEGLRSNVWPKSWKRFMVDFAVGRGLTTLYPNFSDESGYATTLQLGGEHTGKGSHNSNDASNVWPTESQSKSNHRVAKYRENVLSMTYPSSLKDVEVLGIHLEETTVDVMRREGGKFVRGIPDGEGGKYSRMKELWLGDIIAEASSFVDSGREMYADANAEEVADGGVEDLNPTGSHLSPVPNNIASNIFWPLKNVSYKNGVLYFHKAKEEDRKLLTEKYFESRGHLPWGDPNKESSIPPRVTNIELVDHDFDENACESMENRHVVFARVNNPANCFACNQGHLIINIINPMLVYLFFIREKIESFRRIEKGSKITLPLDDTVVLTFGGIPGKPSFLYDFFLRFSNVNMDINSYFDDNKLDDGKIHCFRAIDIPVPGRTGAWDVMYHNLKGRWGTNDFYYNFWREGKKMILSLYDMVEGGGVVRESSESSSEITVSGGKIKVTWALRSGSGTSRDDGNVELIRSVFSKYFDFSFLEGNDFVWKTNERDRYDHTKQTLTKIQSSDVLIGLFGANLWNGLFLPEGKLLIELKSAYGYCANENGRTISSHNRLNFYTSDARKFTVPKKSTSYDEDYLERLAKEILEAHEYSLSNKIPDDWSGECFFQWPNKNFAAGERVLTTNEQAKCYIDEVEPNVWFQLKDRMGWESNCEALLENQPTNSNVEAYKGNGISCPAFCQ